MASRQVKLSLKNLHRRPEGWPLRRLKIPQAHRIAKGSSEMIVAVIDLGYEPHPDHEGHLWMNPNPAWGDVHGWDCHDDDATLELTSGPVITDDLGGHHGFVAGEVMACAPACKVMLVRVGYGNPESWWRGIDYAVEHGARVLAVPHGCIASDRPDKPPLFIRGSDFSYPTDNPEVRRALDDAYDAGCLTFRGIAGNRGRRVASAFSAVDSVISTGSSNRHDKPADVCCSADYVEIGAPCGDRNTGDDLDKVWCTDFAGQFLPRTGGCMATGFAAGVAALVWSRWPDLSKEGVRQLLRNTAGHDTWDPYLGWGVLDAAKAVSIKADRLCQDPRVRKADCSLITRRRKPVMQVTIENRGAFDVAQAMVVAYSDDPRKAVRPRATWAKPEPMITHQIGHAVGPARGLHKTTFDIELVEKPERDVWLQLCTLDRHGSTDVQTVRIPNTTSE